MLTSPSLTPRCTSAPRGTLCAPFWLSLALLLLFAAPGCRGSGDLDENFVRQAATPTGNEVMPNADTATKYAVACGLGSTPDLTLPALGTAATPIRGTNDATQVGKLVSNGWTLVEHFNAAPLCLASLASLKGNLWHKNKGGRDWYYLYRYGDADPTKVTRNLNGILGYDDTSICAFDKIATALPPGDITDLYFAGQFDNDRKKMDDCSDCHVTGYNAPRLKMLGVAKGNNKANDFPWLTAKWLPRWKKYAAAYGPVWKLGKATVVDKWTSGAGAALVAPPNECQTCHGASWIPTRKTDRGFFCESVFKTAFDANGSMSKEGNDFADNATCKAFINAIGCGPGRPGMAPDLTTLCPAPPPAPAPPAMAMVNDRRMLIQGVQFVSATTVNVVPGHNLSMLWDMSAMFALGDPWVDTLQVWGGPYPGSTTSPLTSEISVAGPAMLPGYLQVTGLTPGMTYQLQLRVRDTDTSVSFEPIVIITMPYLPDPGSDGGVGPGSDGGVGPGSDGGVGPGSDGGVGPGSDGGVGPGSDGGVGPGSDGGVDAGSDGGVDAGDDGGVDAGDDGGVDAGDDGGVGPGSDGGVGPVHDAGWFYR
jgi:hypothetical protein